MNGLYAVKARPGPPTVLSADEKNILVQWIQHLRKTVWERGREFTLYLMEREIFLVGK